MGILVKKYVNNKCLLGIWEISEDYDSLYAQVNLHPGDEQKVNSFKNANRKMEWLSVRALLQELAGKNAQIVYDENCKPFLSDHAFNISISHSHKLTSILLSKTRKVGIDLEYMSHNIKKIAGKFVNCEESILSSSDEIEKYHLYIHWCAKEALYKICDKQEINFKDNLRIYPFELNNSGKMKGYVKNRFIDQEFDMEYFRYDNYIVVWCSN